MRQQNEDEPGISSHMARFQQRAVKRIPTILGSSYFFSRQHLAGLIYGEKRRGQGRPSWFRIAAATERT